MIISKLNLYNFRQFKSENGLPGLSIQFHRGLNALVGENDSGKTAVIDAIKIMLLTQSNEYVRPTDDDFYTDDEGNEVSEFEIECIIEDFTENEAKNFIEYLIFEKDNDQVHFSMKLFYRAWKEKNRIYSELRAGQKDDGVILDGKAKELLKVVYLKPLRDAEREMRSGRNSRLSQILLNHPLFNNKQDDHQLKEILNSANEDIERYFTEKDGKEILEFIRTTLAEFNGDNLHNKAQLKTTDIKLKSILESLSLKAPEIHPGLGELNLLFIATELLLLKTDTNGGIRLALIEELEAHLHPQAQLRLINYLQNEYNESGTQIIISTHSPILSSKINLQNIILLKNKKGYDLAYGKTGLEKGDYLFLQRFLDATKANLFFARGIIMVEGDAENLLIPVIAEILDCPLEKYGVSIVNVGSTAFLRYSRIFERNDKTTITIPVSVITDCDIRPYDKIKNEEGTVKKFNPKIEESKQEVEKKEKKYSLGSIQGFIAPRWTLEYCLALSCLSDDFHKAILYGKKIKNSNAHTLTEEKIIAVEKEIESDNQKWSALDKDEQAFEMYKLMLNSKDHSGLKAIVAQCLAMLIKWKILEFPKEKEKKKESEMFDYDLYQYKCNQNKKEKLKERIANDPYLKYIVDAIRHAIGE